MSYTCDLLKVIAESMGNEVNHRFYEIINPPKEDERTADEIALDVIRRAGLKGKQNGST